ncbi:DUF6282 family protein [Actinoplanes missouriensis]|uniref:DUF6282 family protein n=1 Tax=Actinoplanes missouriensis TaxID=1866 RepID=UPI0033D8BF4D
MAHPTATARELVSGAYDTHVHVAPDVMGRRIDDPDLARRFAEVGMAGFVLKSHYLTTAERADRLLDAGFTPGEVRTMAVENSRRLIGQ